MLFPIDTTIISSRSPEEARQSFGISADRIVVMAGCSYWHERRKGGEYLVAALAMLKERRADLAERITVLLVGAGDMPVIRGMGFNVAFAGRVDMQRLMEAYRASDLFVSPSVEDSGPLMVNQAIASGSPVACFDIGVAHDLVLDGETGWKASRGNASELSYSIEKTLSLMQSDPSSVREKCRALYARLSSKISIFNRIDEICR